MAFCPQCGANVADGTPVCQKCGVQLAAQQPQQPQQPVPPVQQIPQGVPYQQAPMPGPAPVPPTYQPKSKMAAGLLGISWALSVCTTFIWDIPEKRLLSF